MWGDVNLWPQTTEQSIALRANDSLAQPYTGIDRWAQLYPIRNESIEKLEQFQRLLGVKLHPSNRFRRKQFKSVIEFRNPSRNPNDFSSPFQGGGNIQQD